MYWHCLIKWWKRWCAICPSRRNCRGKGGESEPRCNCLRTRTSRKWATLRRIKSALTGAEFSIRSLDGGSFLRSSYLRGIKSKQELKHNRPPHSVNLCHFQLTTA